MLRKLLLLLSLILFVLSGMTAFAEPPSSSKSFTEIQEKGKLPILSAGSANRKTLKLKLANGLQAYIISDPAAEKSAASLVVEAGSWEDPQEIPGMAHLTEHMLFLGTKKYPVESEYDRFVTENGGSTNAYTEDLKTTYLFSIKNSSFDEALDRFSSFFKEPLFNPSGLARELQAIGQEYAKNLDDDDFRTYYVTKDIANPDHPERGFSIGNVSTLAKVSQLTINNWYQKHYSAGLMHLVIYSSLPIDTLKELVIRDFSDIPDRNLEISSVKGRMTNPEYDAHFIYITPLKDVRILTMVWELPHAFAHMLESKPDQVVGYVLGDEGRKSLLAMLKSQHLAESLKTGSYNLSPNDKKFLIQIELTEQGLKDVNRVIEYVFEAINNFKIKGVPPHLFEDIHLLQKIAYQYPSKDSPYDTVSNLTKEIVYEDLSTFPERSRVIQKIDPAAVEQLLHFLTPEHCQFLILADPKATGITPDRSEKWIKIPYAVKPIPEQVIEEWAHAAPNPDIDLPGPNPFIPHHLALVNHVEPNKQFPHPKNIVNNDKGNIFFAVDAIYLTPELYCTFEIKAPSFDSGNPLQVVLTDLYIKSLEESLNQFSYTAQVAGLNYQINRTENYGVSITIDGYSEKAPLLFDEILKHLKTVHPTENGFNVYKDSLFREYVNFSKESSLQNGFEVLKSILYKDYVVESEKAKTIANISYQQFLTFLSSLYQVTYVEGLIYGNLTETEALEYWSKLENTLDSKPYPKDNQKKQEVIRLPENQGPFYVETETKAQGNAVLLTIQNPPFTMKDRSAQQVIAQAIQEPFYSELRTKQQTGYIVYSGAEELEMQLFNFFAVQSNTHNPRDLLARFELEIETFLQEIGTELSLERFETIKSAIINLLEIPPKNMKTLGENLKEIAFKHNGDFDWMDKRIHATHELTYDETIAYSKSILGKTNRQRLAIFVKGEISEENIFNYTDVPNVKAMRNLGHYFTRNKWE